MAVYIIAAGDRGIVKIGTAADPVDRLRGFQTGNFDVLRLLRVIEGGRDTERWLHEHYAELWLRAEWFRFCPTMLTIEPGRSLARTSPRLRASRPLVIARAIEAAGGIAAVARRLGLTRQAVSIWRRVPALHVVPLERLGAGVVTRYELRPDVYEEAA